MDWEKGKLHLSYRILLTITLMLAIYFVYQRFLSLHFFTVLTLKRLKRNM